MHLRFVMLEIPIFCCVGLYKEDLSLTTKYIYMLVVNLLSILSSATHCFLRDVGCIPWIPIDGQEGASTSN
jgi:hypothetical protein